MSLPSNDGAPLILVVDDEWLNRELMEGLLSVHGYAVALANGGKQALEIAPERQPDLILLDVRMPDMTGYEVCAALKKEAATQHIPVIMTTAFEVEGEERHKAEAAGATNIVNRLLPTTDLIAFIAGVITTTQNSNKNLPKAKEEKSMFDTLPASAFEAMDWTKDHYQPYFEELLSRDLTEATVDQWLLDLTKISKLYNEVGTRLYIATNVDTTDEKAEARFKTFVGDIIPAVSMAQNEINKKLVASGLEVDGLAVPMRNIRAGIDLFTEANLPLFTEEASVSIEYDKVIGAQTVQWDGEEVTLTKLAPVSQETNRERREKAWRLAMDRRLQDREPLNGLWQQFMAIRGKVAQNADMPSYMDYTWKALGRFDYTPENSVAFQNAIEEVVVPAAKRLYEKRQKQLGLDRLRPWDLAVDTKARDPLRPYDTIEQMNRTLESIFTKVDPELGAHFKIMREENLLDLDNRKGKAPGGYCATLSMVGRPFIFMNAVGLHDDVQTLLHEGGHAFHVFEAAHLPYIQQDSVPMEFAEVASMAMELIASPYLAKEQGGFYTEKEAARARIEHLETLITFWPYMAVVDAFQHWVYANHEAATHPANCDAKWSELWDRFMVGVDYSGLEDVKATGWHRKLHIFQRPFYYVEYGLAQLGAVQVWAKSLENQAEAVKNYRKALALAGTVKLPDLFTAAGAKFAFDAKTLSSAVELIEKTINKLEQV